MTGPRESGEMRIERIEDIAEMGKATPPAGRVPRVGRPPDGSPLRAFDDRIAILAETLAVAPVEEHDAALARVVETLGRGLGADRVCCLVPASGASGPGVPSVAEDDRLDTRAIWSRRAGRVVVGEGRTPAALPPAILNGTSGEVGAGLRAGRIQRLPSLYSLPLPPGTDVGLGELAGRSGWTPLRPIWLVPCLAPVGLLGVLCIEGGPAGRPPQPAVVARIERVARLAAGLLDRHRLARELAALRVDRRREDRLALLGRATSSVAHDLNNVLTAILGYADLLELDLPDEPSGRAELGEIREAAERGAGLVEQVLRFGRPREQGAEPVEVDALLQGLRGMLERVLGERVELSIEAPAAGAAGARVEVDAGRLEQVLLNLAANARDAIAAHGAGRGHFVLSTRVVTVDGTRGGSQGGASLETGLAACDVAPGRYLRISAADDGCGVDPAYLRRVFEPFFTTKAPGEGTGLGLATAAELMREIGGAIRVESDPGEGSAFHLDLPLCAPVGPRRRALSVEPSRLA